jgi:hypothetical protein
MATYHRLHSPSQSLETAVYQTYSEELWGKAARGSDRPAVKACTGPLPPNTSGIEFETDIPPNLGSAPEWPKWYLGICPQVVSVPEHPDFCKMQVTMTKVVHNNPSILCNF